ncbi:MAG: epoxide hydrolase N-terminal domain-containing protein, partial [Thermodesulfobacteriota bacterium]
RQHERAINTFRHYRVTIDGQPIHFLHEPGTGPKPMPSAPFSRPCLFSRFP